MNLPFDIPVIHWAQIIDLGLVFVVIYLILSWVKSTQSLNLVRGILIVLGLVVVSRLLQLTTLNWLIEKLTTILILLLLIIFQPELRKILDHIGRGRLFGRRGRGQERGAAVIKHLLRAVEALSKDKIGALIVLKLEAGLKDYEASGVAIDGDLSSELLINLFWPNTPTHDGATIIDGDKIIAAGCLLPLTESRIIDRRLGTRHRAAIGLSEVTDAIVIVISEETGIISIAEHGNLTRFLNREALETRLFNLYSDKPEDQKGFINGLKNMATKKETP